MNEIAKRAGGGSRLAGENLDPVDRSHRTLRVDVELPYRLDLDIEPLEPRGTRLLPRKDIEDSTAPCKLTARGNGRGGKISRLLESAFDLLDGDFLSALKVEQFGFEGGLGWNGRVPLRRVNHHDLVPFFSQSAEQVEPLGFRLGIGQCLLAGNFEIGK